MKKMSRVLTFILVLALCLSCMMSTVSAADGDPATSTESPSTEPTSTDPPPAEPVASAAPVPAAKARPFVPDISGRYRTSRTKILGTLDPVAIAGQDLVIDPVTYAVGNLYDSEGNLITCTLSSDGHFYIVPVNEGYVYIPTDR